MSQGTKFEACPVCDAQGLYVTISGRYKACRACRRIFDRNGKELMARLKPLPLKPLAKAKRIRKPRFSPEELNEQRTVILRTTCDALLAKLTKEIKDGAFLAKALERAKRARPRVET